MTLQELKNHLKKVKPKFLAQDSHKYKRLANKWKKGRGSDSKIRRKIQGRRLRVEIGYRTPKALRGTTRTGMQKLYINNKSELMNANLENACVVLNKKLGNRSKLELLKLCKEKNVKVLAYKDLDKQIKLIEDTLKARKANKKAAKETTEKKETAKTTKKAAKKVVKKAAKKEEAETKEDAPEAKK